MRENERKWKKMRENERKWDKMKENERKWKKMKNERKCQKMKENVRKCKKMKENKSKWKKIKENERKWKKMKENERTWKKMKNWIHTQNPRRFPWFTVVVGTFFVELLDDFHDFVSECVSFQRKINNPFWGVIVFPKKSDNCHFTWNKNTHFTDENQRKKFAKVSPSNNNYSPGKTNHPTTTTNHHNNNTPQQHTTTTTGCLSPLFFVVSLLLRDGPPRTGAAQRRKGRCVFCFTSNENCHFSLEKRWPPETGCWFSFGKRHIPKQNHGNRRGFCAWIQISSFSSFFIIFHHFSSFFRLFSHFPFFFLLLSSSFFSFSSFIFFHLLSSSLVGAQNLIFWASISLRFLSWQFSCKNQVLCPYRGV